MFRRIGAPADEGRWGGGGIPLAQPDRQTRPGEQVVLDTNHPIAVRSTSKGPGTPSGLFRCSRGHLDLHGLTGPFVVGHFNVHRHRIVRPTGGQWFIMIFMYYSHENWTVLVPLTPSASSPTPARPAGSPKHDERRQGVAWPLDSQSE